MDVRPAAMVLALALGLFSGPSSAQEELCDISGAVTTGLLQDSRLSESSGLASSRVNPGILYVHNDHGDSARVFAVNEEGATVAELQLLGADAVDFEDITIGAVGGVNFVFVADMGNNRINGSRDAFVVYRFQEPDLSEADGDVIGVEYLTIHATTPEFFHEDQEAFTFDPVSGDLYFFQKNHFVADANIYRLTPPEESNDPEDPIVADFVGIFAQMNLVAGDISLDGTKILLKNYDEGYMWEDRDPSESVEEVLTTRQPCTLQLQEEPQGESLCVSAEMDGFFTVSEGSLQPIYFYLFGNE